MIALLKPFFIGFLAFTSLRAEILFDLQEQYFEHAHKQSATAGLYKLPNVSVSTINISQSKDGKYVTEYASSGMMIVRLNKPRKNFVISLTSRYKSTYKLRTSSIVLKSDNGDDFVVLLANNQLIIQDEKFTYPELHKNTLHINIQKLDDSFKVSINGKVLCSHKMEGFSSLKRLEQTINNVNGTSSEDSIYDIVIAGK